MEYSQEFAQQFLKVAAKSKNREKKIKVLEETRKVEIVRKEIKRKAGLMQKSIMPRQDIEREETQSPYFQQEKKKIVQMSDLVIHSQRGVEKEPKEIQSTHRMQGKNIFLEKKEPIILTPKNVNVDTVLEAPLPPTFKKIQPTIPMAPIAPTSLVSLPDFGQISELIRDGSISIIQCDGPDTNVKINKGGKIEKTEIILNEQEIKSIIRKFAERAEKELTQPIFKASISNLEITAISSDFSGNRFVITKK